MRQTTACRCCLIPSASSNINQRVRNCVRAWCTICTVIAMHSDRIDNHCARTDAIAADMATIFERHPKVTSISKRGMRLRNEIYAMGDSRDINESIEKFLGRRQSVQPFLKNRNQRGIRLRRR